MLINSECCKIWLLTTGQYIVRSELMPSLIHICQNFKKYIYIIKHQHISHVYYKMRVMATALTLATQARRVKTQDPSNILNDKPNGICILPTAPMPTEKLITYLPTYDNTILYVMITLVSINLMILLYKFLTRKLQHSTIVLELSTGHRCITHPLINVPLCSKMYHYLARENFSHMKVEGWIRPMLLWERGQITIVNFLDHSELQFLRKPLSQYGKESN